MINGPEKLVFRKSSLPLLLKQRAELYCLGLYNLVEKFNLNLNPVVDLYLPIQLLASFVYRNLNLRGL